MQHEVLPGGRIRRWVGGRRAGAERLETVHQLAEDIERLGGLLGELLPCGLLQAHGTASTKPCLRVSRMIRSPGCGLATGRRSNQLLVGHKHLAKAAEAKAVARRGGGAAARRRLAVVVERRRREEAVGQPGRQRRRGVRRQRRWPGPGGPDGDRDQPRQRRHSSQICCRVWEDGEPRCPAAAFFLRLSTVSTVSTAAVTTAGLRDISNLPENCQKGHELCQTHLRGTSCDAAAFAAASPPLRRPRLRSSSPRAAAAAAAAASPSNATMANVPMKGRSLIAVIGDEVRGHAPRRPRPPPRRSMRR